MADAQLLLFDLDSPPAAPGRVAAKPPRPPNRSAASGKILRTGAEKPALTAPRTQTGPPRYPPSHGNAVSAQERRFAPQSRRGARSRIALTGACVPIAGTGRTGAATPKRQGRSGRHGDGAEDRPRGGAGDPARGGAKVPGRGRGWRGVDIVLDWPEQSRRPRRCQATSRVVDPIDSRIRRVTPAPRRDWKHDPLLRPLYDKPVTDLLAELTGA